MKREILLQLLNNAIEEVLANLHTTLIAKVTAVSDTTINCQPVINRVVNGESIKLPEFVEVPCITLQGGGSYISMPISEGDYCLLMINERCFDSWYNGQDFVSPLELRMHDYSDAFAIVGVNPQAQDISIPDVIEIKGDSEQEGNYTITGDVDVTGSYTQLGNFELTGNMEITGNVIINGTLTVNGAIAGQNFTGIGGTPMTSTADIQTTGDITAGAISLKNHVHGGVQTGGGTTGGPQ